MIKANRINGQIMPIKDVHQADYFIKNGLVPKGIKTENNKVVILFIRTDKLTEVCDEWIKIKHSK